MGPLRLRPGLDLGTSGLHLLFCLLQPGYTGVMVPSGSKVPPNVRASGVKTLFTSWNLGRQAPTFGTGTFIGMGSGQAFLHSSHDNV